MSQNKIVFFHSDYMETHRISRSSQSETGEEKGETILLTVPLTMWSLKDITLPQETHEPDPQGPCRVKQTWVGTGWVCRCGLIVLRIFWKQEKGNMSPSSRHNSSNVIITHRKFDTCMRSSNCSHHRGLGSECMPWEAETECDRQCPLPSEFQDCDA